MRLNSVVAISTFFSSAECILFAYAHMIFILLFYFIKDSKINQIREINEKETRTLESKITIKLVSAEENRLEKLNSTLERLKEHVSYYFYFNF